MLTPSLPQDIAPQTGNIVQSELDVLQHGNVAQFVKEILLRQALKREVRQNVQEAITTGVTVVDLQNNHTIYGHDQNTPHFAASVNKLPVTMLVLEELRAGNVTLDTQLTWVPSDRRAGAGVYDQDGSPLQGTVREVLHDLLNRSGNTAVRILVNNVLGGAAAVNDRLAQIPEIPHTRLTPVDPNRFFLGDTTSKEALFVMRRVLATDDQYTAVVKEFLVTNIFTDIGVKSQLAGNDYIVLVNKIGQLNDPEGNNRHDVGVIYNTKTHKSYGFSFLTTSPPESATATTRAIESLKTMGRYVLRFAGDKPQQQTQQPFATPQGSQSEGRVLY